MVAASALVRAAASVDFEVAAVPLAEVAQAADFNFKE